MLIFLSLTFDNEFDDLESCPRGECPGAPLSLQIMAINNWFPADEIDAYKGVTLPC